MKNKCEKSIGGKHQIEKGIITYNEVSNGYRVVNKIPVYAEYCIKCKKWGRVFDNKSSIYSQSDEK